MALRQVASRLKASTSRLKRQTDPEGHAKGDHWRKWYSTAEWRRLKRTVHVRDGFTCQMQGCGVLIDNPVERIADHKIPHRGDRSLFFDPANVQTLCKACHDGRKQRLERSPQGRGGSNP